MGTLTNRLRSDCRGNVSIVFAAAALPLLGVLGCAVDFGRASLVESQLQVAADAAALKVALSRSGENGQVYADKFLSANFTAPFGSNLKSTRLLVRSDPTQTSYEYRAKAAMPSTFLRILGIDHIDVTAVAHSAVGQGAVEVALILDSTGSMGSNGRMPALKAATKSLIDKLDLDNVKIAVVPFDTQVRLEGVPGLSGELSNQPNPYDPSVDCASIADAEDRQACETAIRNTGTPPDGYTDVETDTSTSGDDDDDDEITTVVKTYSYSDGSKVRITKAYQDETVLSQVTHVSTDGGTNWQYAQAPATTKDNSTISANNDLLINSGQPWSGCVVDRQQPFDVSAQEPNLSDTETLYPKSACARSSLQSVLPLTTDTALAKARVDELQPSGNTNITIGLQWGLEALSPNHPLIGGAAFGSPGAEKHIILVTDGLNTQNRWSKNSATIDARTQMACNAAKAAGVIIHTVRLQDGNAALLSSCASKPQNFYDVQNVGALDAAFDQILPEITKVRLTQ